MLSIRRLYVDCALIVRMRSLFIDCANIYSTHNILYTSYNVCVWLVSVCFTRARWFRRREHNMIYVRERMRPHNVPASDALKLCAKAHAHERSHKHKTVCRGVPATSHHHQRSEFIRIGVRSYARVECYSNITLQNKREHALV